MRLAIICVAVVAMVACSLGARQDELTGEYSLVADNATVHLSVRRDGSYSQVVTYKDGHQASVSGTWEYDERNHDITFPRLYVVQGRTVGGVVVHVMDVTKFMGQVRLEADPNEGTVYKKK